VHCHRNLKFYSHVNGCLPGIDLAFRIAFAFCFVVMVSWPQSAALQKYSTNYNGRTKPDLCNKYINKCKFLSEHLSAPASWIGACNSWNVGSPILLVRCLHEIIHNKIILDRSFYDDSNLSIIFGEAIVTSRSDEYDAMTFSANVNEARNKYSIHGGISTIRMRTHSVWHLVFESAEAVTFDTVVDIFGQKWSENKMEYVDRPLLRSPVAPPTHHMGNKRIRYALDEGGFINIAFKSNGDVKEMYVDIIER